MLKGLNSHHHHLRIIKLPMRDRHPLNLVGMKEPAQSRLSINLNIMRRQLVKYFIKSCNNKNNSENNSRRLLRISY